MQINFKSSIEIQLNQMMWCNNCIKARNYMFFVSVLLRPYLFHHFYILKQRGTEILHVQLIILFRAWYYHKTASLRSEDKVRLCEAHSSAEMVRKM